MGVLATACARRAASGTKIGSGSSLPPYSSALQRTLSTLAERPLIIRGDDSAHAT